MGGIGMDAEGIPIPLMPEHEAFVQQVSVRQARREKMTPGEQPLLALDQEAADEIELDRLEAQPWLVEVAPESLAALIRQLNSAQLAEALRTGGPVEARHMGKRYILAPSETSPEGEAQELRMRMGSLQELSPMTPGRSLDAPIPGRPGALAPGIFVGVTTNLPPERLPAATAMQWALRARETRSGPLRPSRSSWAVPLPEKEC